MQATIYELALANMPLIGEIQAKLLIQQFGSAENVFNASFEQLQHTEGIGPQRAGYIYNFNCFKAAEASLSYLNASSIQALFITNNAYPQRLIHCYDPPTLLYYKGKADLNQLRILSVIGTRNYSGYGKLITERFISELSDKGILIVSGLAFGIDSIAHHAAIHNNIPTVAVMANGLDKIYPSEHRDLARKMQDSGGILSEYPPGTVADKHHFPKRNRIVAGMSDAVVVMESDIKGGSMITANLAFNYNRDVFAFPGRVTDNSSKGANALIAQQQAQLIQNAEELMLHMGWSTAATKQAQQVSLFPDLSEAALRVVTILKENDTVPIDKLAHCTQLTPSKLAEALLELELNNLIAQKPGKAYKLICF